MRRWMYGAVCGLLAGAAGVALAQLVAAAARPQSSPLVTVGGSVIDATPTPLKEFAIRQFGTNDKLVLLAGIGAGLAVFAAVVGIVGARKRIPGLIGAGAFGVIGVVAALTRPASVPRDVLPAIVGGIVAIAVLAWLLDSLDGRSFASNFSKRAARRAENDMADEQVRVPAKVEGVAPALNRRGFLRAGVIVAVGTALIGIGGSALARARSGSIAKLRSALRLPTPADVGPPRVTVPGFYTANADFYRVDTALTVPRIDPDTWRLRIHGMVDRPITLNLDQLLARPLIQRDITLNCVSNEVGGPYVGTARWLGAPLAALLTEAGIKAGADQVVARSIDGMTIGTPVGTIMDGRDAMLAVGMNGEPLPLEHGFPVRMLTPGLYGYVGACKWLVDIEVTTFAAYDPYWVKREWSRMAPVKTASRIDRPIPFTRIPAGDVNVQGVAWAQHRGIEKVEVQVDDGAWESATLSPVPSVDTWTQWSWRWPATPGPHQLRVRATDGTGTPQAESRVPTFPNGATGWHTLAVTIG